MRRLSLLATLSLLAMLVLSPSAFAQNESNDLDCDSFGTQAAAQQNLRSNPSDPNNLDADEDRIACEDFDYPEGAPRDETPVPTSGGGGTTPPAEQPQQTRDLDCVDFVI